MFVAKLIARNAMRHKLRTALTVLGLVIAVLAYGLLQTVVDAWYAGASAASNARLVTRNAISLTFTLPLSYENRIKGVDGVTMVARSNWFGGSIATRRTSSRSSPFPTTISTFTPNSSCRLPNAPITSATAGAR
jgi:hypothetical protein